MLARSKAGPATERGRNSTTPRIAIVIVNFARPELTSQCLASLNSKGASYPDLEVIVVDGGSATARSRSLNSLWEVQTLITGSRCCH